MPLPHIRALPKFERQFKKLFPKEQHAVRAELERVASRPETGELKKGDLSRVRVHKFKIRHQLFLLAYEWHPASRTLYLYALGTHENFYTALKRYFP